MQRCYLRLTRLSFILRVLGKLSAIKRSYDLLFHFVSLVDMIGFLAFRQFHYPEIAKIINSYYSSLHCYRRLWLGNSFRSEARLPLHDERQFTEYHLQMNGTVSSIIRYDVTQRSGVVVNRGARNVQDRGSNPRF